METKVAISQVLLLIPEAGLVDEADHEICLTLPPGMTPPRLTLKGLGPGVLAALKQLSVGSSSRQQLNEIILQSEGFAGVIRFSQYLTRFSELGLLQHRLQIAEALVATLAPLGIPADPSLSDQVFDVSRQYVLSRFCYIHRDDANLVLESPLSSVKLVLHDWRATALLGILAVPQRFDALCAALPSLPVEVVQALCEWLVGMHALSLVDDQARIEEDTQPNLVQWSLHDLIFHRETRAGRRDTRLATDLFRFLGEIDPLPAVPPAASNETIPLYRPDIEALKSQDIPFTRVLEQRKSIRDFGEVPITAEQLGEFLYRSARVRRIFEIPVIGSSGKGTMQCSDRVYPSAGACYDLSLYLTVNQCEGIEPGFYYYCPQQHELQKLSDYKPSVEMMLKMAHSALKSESDAPLPQVLITFGSRFQRLTWKYPTLPYSLTLKNVGVLQQTMYLVTEAMGLAGSAVGSGDSDLFAKVRGCDYFFESSVGEYVLGSRSQIPAKDGIYSAYITDLWREA